MYGVECTPAPKRELGIFRTACKKALQSAHASSAAPALVFAAAPGTSADPLAVLAQRRLVMARRMLWRYPELRGPLCSDIGTLSQQGHVGTVNEGRRGGLCPPGRKGPLRLLLCTLHEHGLWITPELVIHQA
eukprot:6186176-Alexandrium_andersonii.AAC.1